MSGTHVHLLPPFSVPVTSALAVVALLYMCGWLRLRTAVPSTSRAWRLVAFLSGLFFAWIVLGSPLSALDHSSLTIHMINHLVLMLVVAPLVLVGAPAMPLLLGLPARFRRSVHDLLLHSWPAQLLLRLFRHPVFCWLSAAVAVIGWHVPAVFQMAMRSHWWHDVEYASFTVAGLLFWWPVVQAWPSTSKWPESSMLLYLFLATLSCDILSGFLVFCDRVVYPVFLSSPQSFGMSALEDQQCAGALMWTFVTVVYLIAGAIFTSRLLSPHWSKEKSILQFESQRIAVPHTDSQRMEVV